MIHDPFPWIEELIIPIVPVLRIFALRPLRVVETAVRPLLAVHVHAAIHRAVRKRRTAQHWVCPAQNSWIIEKLRLERAITVGHLVRGECDIAFRVELLPLGVGVREVVQLLV